jgi:putative membrane protein
MKSFTTLSIGEKILFFGTVVYMLLFGAHYLRALNFEFLGYYFILVCGFSFVYATLARSQFPLYILSGLSLWGLLHMAGGSVPVGDTVLYGYKIYPFLIGEGQFYVLKMDQVIHAFGFGVTALVAHHLLLTHAWREGVSHVWLKVAAVCIATGLGAFNEVIEFLVLVTVEENGVGDIYNMGLDLIFNLGGAIIATILAHVLTKRVVA